jgi:hypothetical protein
MSGRIIDCALWLVRFANYLERNDNTRYWNPWIISRRYNP